MGTILLLVLTEVLMSGRCVQAEGSWDYDQCCSKKGNRLLDQECIDQTSSGDFIFGLSPDQPERFGPKGGTKLYQTLDATGPWPWWGTVMSSGPGDITKGDLNLGAQSLGRGGACDQGNAYTGSGHQICGGDDSRGSAWGETDIEVWFRVSSNTPRGLP